MLVSIQLLKPSICDFAREISGVVDLIPIVDLVFVIDYNPAHFARGSLYYYIMQHDSTFLVQSKALPSNQNLRFLVRNVSAVVLPSTTKLFALAL